MNTPNTQEADTPTHHDFTHATVTLTAGERQYLLGLVRSDMEVYPDNDALAVLAAKLAGSA